MDSQKVDQIHSFSQPDYTQWSCIQSSVVELTAAPLGLQPNGFVQASTEVGHYGLTEKILVKTVHDDERIAFWLSWQDNTRDEGVGEGFPDGAVIAFPVRGDPAIYTMGDDVSPIHAIHWSADKNQIRSVLATGIGTSREGPDLAPEVNGTWADRQWTIVITHDLSSPDPDSVRLSPGKKGAVGFVVWDGGRMERAGLKSYSPVWVDLNLTNQEGTV